MYFEELNVGMTVQIPPALIEKEKMMAIADPHGLSGDSYPDGTPMTNWERWEKLNKRGGQH